MNASKIIGENCKTILAVLKEGTFEREDLEFLQKFFNKILEATDKLLKKK